MIKNKQTGAIREAKKRYKDKAAWHFIKNMSSVNRKVNAF